MESSREADTAHTFSQVVFIDIPHSYPPSGPVTCCYSLSATLQPNARDWVGIFKVGWSTTKDYHTFVWVEPCVDVLGPDSARQAVFKEYYLPKDEIDFYQFCYVDSTGQVRGASTPFCFKNPTEQMMESSSDDDLLVITTQEQVEQSVREKAELQRELDQMREENETLKNDLQQEQQEAASLKGQKEQKEKEMSELLKEMDQMKEENENLKSILQQQEKETDTLKEQRGEASRQKEEKLERAVKKINQLKEVREELRGKLDAQSAEVSTLNSKLREQEREVFTMKDSIQLLQVDLQSSEKEKQRLSAELQRTQSVALDVDDVKRENRELCRRLSQQDCPDEDLRVQYQTVVSQLQDAQLKLEAEKEETRNTKRHAEFLDKELLQVKEQLEKVVASCEQAQRRTNKQDLQLAEAHAAIADKDAIIEEKEHMILLERHEKEELTKENQNLVSDIEALRRAYDDLQAAPNRRPDAASPAADGSQQQESPEQAENIGSAADTEEEEALVCRHCQESFPCITRHELEQHEQSHRVCPFCTMICDGMDQSVFEDHVYSHEL